jgi:glycosidase
MVGCSILLSWGCTGTAGGFANTYDLQRAEALRAREADWRNGPVVYQVIVDRFAPPEDLESKRSLYPAPKKLRSWDETPTRGEYLPEVNVWSHEIDFWGGDLDSLRSRLDYVHELGVDVLYLNPIHMAYTNHKYDAQDYFEISPEYGTRDDFRALAKDVHARDMRLLLDGVFNHMGATSPWFQDALNNPDSEWREWFLIGSEYDLGYLAWVNVPNLPEVNLESEHVRGRIYGDCDSVIQGYLRDGADGWRLDVAFDIGFNYLSELTQAAHAAKHDSVVIGEVWNYPEQWMPALDGIMNMTMRQMILDMIRGDLSGMQFGHQLETMVEDTGLEPLLKSHLVLDNHDTPRLAELLQDPAQRRTAQVLQFTLPGSPVIYYGTELGMRGGDDPEQRAPMRWDLADDENGDLQWVRGLLAMRDRSAALRFGDFRLLDTARSLAFMRWNERVADTRIILCNPSDERVKEFLVMRDSKIMSYSRLRDELGSGVELTVMAGTLNIEIPPRTIWVLRPVVEQQGDYTPFKRVQ